MHEKRNALESKEAKARREENKNKKETYEQH